MGFVRTNMSSMRLPCSSFTSYPSHVFVIHYRYSSSTPDMSAFANLEDGEKFTLNKYGPARGKAGPAGGRARPARQVCGGQRDNPCG